MNIIFGRENAEKLREKYTVLDLEKLAVEGKEVPQPTAPEPVVPGGRYRPRSRKSSKISKTKRSGKSSKNVRSRKANKAKRSNKKH